MKDLSEEEIKQLPPAQRWDYYQQLRVAKWDEKTLAQKDQEVLSDLSFLVARGDPLAMANFEMALECAIANTNLENISFDRQFIKTVQVIQNRINQQEEFYFFWQTKSPFSQWYQTHFTETSFILFETKADLHKREDLLDNLFPLQEQEYTSAEQFMMYQKAMLFLDRTVAQKIMATRDVRKIKELGRQVRGFDNEIWKYFRSLIVYRGNRAKFTQNEDLKFALLETAHKTLVEAAPNDSVWGIGLAESDPRALKRETWIGQNLLGEILTQIREDLI